MLKSHIQISLKSGKDQQHFLKMDNCSQLYENWRMLTSKLERVASSLANEECND